jgi:hypothetical protein
MQPLVQSGIGTKSASIASIQTDRSLDSSKQGWVEHRSGAAICVLSIVREQKESRENQQGKACAGWTGRKLRCFSDFVNFPLAGRSGYP